MKVIFSSATQCCITDTVSCRDEIFAADSSSSHTRKFSFFSKAFLRTWHLSSDVFSTFDEKSSQKGSSWFAYLFSAKTSINYGLRTNHSFTKTVFLWPVLWKIHAMWCHFSVVAAWWLITKNIVNCVVKLGLNYFGDERSMIKETKKVWHLPVSLYLWQLYKILFFRFFWMHLVNFFQ